MQEDRPRDPLETGLEAAPEPHGVEEEPRKVQQDQACRSVRLVIFFFTLKHFYQPQTGIRPGTSARGGFGFQVADRPITQQGLGGLKNSFQNTGRTVQDKTFFQTELRQKINLLTNEISRLTSEGDALNRENSNYATFEKRADILADELRDLQGQLGDLNTLVDKLHADADLNDIERTINQLKSKNQRESQILDDIFLQRQQRENQLREMEKAIDGERRKSEAQINELDPKRRAQYYELKEQNQQYLLEIQQRQVDMDNLTAKVAGASTRGSPRRNKAENAHRL
ncbi:hypothetical protein DFJ73DRAFT_353433 [Zopfochytrium polystomum]|nr:hypothetical protein DFJ73DRAFT_353433 [Zopfochytrium polystomum]